MSSPAAAGQPPSPKRQRLFFREQQNALAAAEAKAAAKRNRKRKAKENHRNSSSQSRSRSHSSHRRAVPPNRIDDSRQPDSDLSLSSSTCDTASAEDSRSKFPHIAQSSLSAGGNLRIPAAAAGAAGEIHSPKNAETVGLKLQLDDDCAELDAGTDNDTVIDGEVLIDASQTAAVRSPLTLDDLGNCSSRTEESSAASPDHLSRTFAGDTTGDSSTLSSYLIPRQQNKSDLDDRSQSMLSDGVSRARGVPPLDSLDESSVDSFASDEVHVGTQLLASIDLGLADPSAFKTSSISRGNVVHVDAREYVTPVSRAWRNVRVAAVSRGTGVVPARDCFDSQSPFVSRSDLSSVLQLNIPNTARKLLRVQQSTPAQPKTNLPNVSTIDRPLDTDVDFAVSAARWTKEQTSGGGNQDLDDRLTSPAQLTLSESLLTGPTSESCSSLKEENHSRTTAGEAYGCVVSAWSQDLSPSEAYVGLTCEPATQQEFSPRKEQFPGETDSFASDNWWTDLTRCRQHHTSARDPHEQLRSPEKIDSVEHRQPAVVPNPPQTQLDAADLTLADETHERACEINSDSLDCDSISSFSETGGSNTANGQKPRFARQASSSILADYLLHYTQTAPSEDATTQEDIASCSLASDASQQHSRSQVGSEPEESHSAETLLALLAQPSPQSLPIEEADQTATRGPLGMSLRKPLTFGGGGLIPTKGAVTARPAVAYSRLHDISVTNVFHRALTTQDLCESEVTNDDSESNVRTTSDDSSFSDVSSSLHDTIMSFQSSFAEFPGRDSRGKGFAVWGGANVDSSHKIADFGLAVNGEIVSHLASVLRQTQANRYESGPQSEFLVRALKRAIDAVQRCPWPIVGGNQARAGLQGIGDYTARLIDDCLGRLNLQPKNSTETHATIAVPAPLMRETPQGVRFRVAPFRDLVFRLPAPSPVVLCRETAERASQAVAVRLNPNFAIFRGLMSGNKTEDCLPVPASSDARFCILQDCVYSHTTRDTLRCRFLDEFFVTEEVSIRAHNTQPHVKKLWRIDPFSFDTVPRVDLANVAEARYLMRLNREYVLEASHPLRAAVMHWIAQRTAWTNIAGASTETHLRSLLEDATLLVHAKNKSHSATELILAADCYLPRLRCKLCPPPTLAVLRVSAKLIYRSAEIAPSSTVEYAWTKMHALCIHAENHQTHKHSRIDARMSVLLASCVRAVAS